MAGLYHPTWEDESDALTALRHDDFEDFRAEHPELEDQLAYLLGDPDAGRDDCDDARAWSDPTPAWDETLGAFVPY